MRTWCNGSHAALRTPCRNACRFKSCCPYQRDLTYLFVVFTSAGQHLKLPFLPLGELSNGGSGVCKTLTFGYVGSSPTSLTRDYCLPVSSVPRQINGLETGIICVCSIMEECTWPRTTVVGVRILSGVPPSAVRGKFGTISSGCGASMRSTSCLSRYL